ncbi:MAG: peptidoglycan-binding protein [Eubacteriales bacterium]|nr:peptidoglycan-binding protein [Eubacteriales bacterium]
MMGKRAAAAIVLALLCVCAAATAERAAEDPAYPLRIQADPLQTMLDIGMRGEEVRALQTALRKYGFLSAQADGIYGERTAQAVSDVKAYLQDLGVEQRYIDDLQPQSAVSSALLGMLTEGEWESGGRSLKPGESGAAVLAVQKRLRALDYPAESDGSFGAQTAYGVELFRYFEAGGEGDAIDAALRAALFSDSARPARYVPLQRGSSGAAVKNLQAQLRLQGFLNGSADGSYGPGTQSAVRLMQECLAERGYSVEPNGIADPYLQEIFFEQFDPAPQALQRGARGADVARMQRRLTLYGFQAGSGDGQYGPSTVAAVQRFQKRNGLKVTGEADVQTLQKLYSSDIKGALKSYQIKVSVEKQKVYVYALDDNYEYTKLVRTMTCSTGLPETPTPKGTFTNTGPGPKWHYFRKYDCWAQYPYYIHGNIWFHSVLFSEQDEDTLLWGSVYNLGKPASHGCVRLAVEDAKWLHNNCAAGTTVIVY